MKRLMFVVLLFGVVERSIAQDFEFGLRDSQFAKLGYVFSNSVFLGIEQSLLNVKMREQSGHLLLGYRHSYHNWNNNAYIYAGIEYGGRWHRIGAQFQSGYKLKSFILTGTINPNYDSGLDFQLNYDIDAGFIIFQKVNNYLDNVIVGASFGNIPEFRDNIKNLRVGIKFTSARLWVHPEISLPGIDQNANFIRVLCNFGWKLRCK